MQSVHPEFDPDTRTWFVPGLTAEARTLRELRELLGGPLDPEQLENARTIALGTLSTGSTAVDVALDVARDHAVKARDALDGADGLDPDVCRTLGRLVDGLVHRER